MSTEAELELAKRRLELLKRENEERELLPFLHYDLYDWQDEFINCTKHRQYLTCANQVGKLITHSTIVPTPSGPTTHGELKEGDFVFGQDGKPTKVVGVFPHKNVQCYRITFNDGSFVDAGDEHLWICKGSEERFRKTSKRYNQWQVKSTEQIIKDGGYNPDTRAYNRHSIPVTSPVEYEEDSCLFDPYLTGLLIGDGSFSGVVNSIKLCKPDIELMDILKVNHKIKQAKDKKGFILSDIGKHYPDLKGKRSWEKFIPSRYLYGSVKQRMDLLSGLMDTDGSCDVCGRMEYSTSSPELADDFVTLATSLGCKVVRDERVTSYTYLGEKKKGRPSFRLHLYCTFNPFKLTRKANRYRSQERYKHERVIKNIEPIGKVDANCIMVDNGDHSYLVTNNHIVTHNTFAAMLKTRKLCQDVEFRTKIWGDNQPKMGWYVLPSQDTINDFYYTKWVPEILAKGKYKDEGKYAWKLIKNQQNVRGIHFLETGFILSFISLGSRLKNLQSRTLGFIIFDEEPDVAKLPEFEMRTASYNDPKTGKPNSILGFAFTPTSGQEYFKDIFNYHDQNFLDRIPSGVREEYFPGNVMFEDDQLAKETFPLSDDVWKRRVSTFEATRFKSGQPGKFTKERIVSMLGSIPSKRERMIRVFGSFEREDLGGLIIPSYDQDKHFIDDIVGAKYGKGYFTAGLDYGSGTNHSSSVAITWISNDHKRVRVVDYWKGDKGIPTTAGDVVEKYISMIKPWVNRGHNIRYSFYDWSCADMKHIAHDMGYTLHPAEKGNDIGFQLFDGLLQYGVMKFHNKDKYGWLLHQELMGMMQEQKKKDRNDDIFDAIRYSIAALAHLFDLSHVVPLKPVDLVALEKKEKLEDEKRKHNPRDWRQRRQERLENMDEIDIEIDDWSSYHEY